ncbi:MAG: hypothetical protein M0Q44_01445 [Methylobacter sp.]|jgi:hypothetical protein|nr:hypothetical protein [Methylobacter sp.]
MNRYNRIFIGLMEMCNTGYWTPAEEACHDLRLERYQFELSVANQNPANNTDAMPTYKAWSIGFIGALLGMVIGALIRQTFV